MLIFIKVLNNFINTKAPPSLFKVFPQYHLPMTCTLNRGKQIICNHDQKSVCFDSMYAKVPPPTLKTN